MSVTKEEIEALVAKASCVDSCIPRGMQAAALISLIQTIAEDTSTPRQLMDKARCIDKCVPPGMMMPILVALGAESSQASCTFEQGSGSPVGAATPDFIGQLYHDTVADTYYRSTGLTVADWIVISRGGDTFGLFSFGDSAATGSVVINDTTCVPGYDIESEPNVTSISFPNLVSIDPLNLQSGSITCSLNPALTSISLPSLNSVAAQISLNTNNVLNAVSFPLLTSIGAYFSCNGCPLLASISLPSLTSLGAYFSVTSNPALTTVDLSSWVPLDGKNYNFSGCALNAASVELILRRLVLAGVTTCTINLSGGTNAGVASLNAQGQADVVTLGAQLVINP